MDEHFGIVRNESDPQEELKRLTEAAERVLGMLDEGKELRLESMTDEGKEALRHLGDLVPGGWGGWLTWD